MTEALGIIQGMLSSPCVGICRIDDATGWCLGCARDVNELGCWRDLSPAAQALIWADLPRRKAILGLSFRLLPWSGAALAPLRPITRAAVTHIVRAALRRAGIKAPINGAHLRESGRRRHRRQQHIEAPEASTP